MADNRTIARRAARRYFGPKGQSLFMAQMGQEAGFKTGLTSSAGAQGPAQIMPGTAKAWGVRNVNDPEEAYNAAAKNMAKYLRAYNGSWDKALTAYNAGPGRVGGPLPAETQHYIKTIRARAGQYAAGSGPQDKSAAGPHTPGTTLRQTIPTFDKAGYEQARRQAIVGSMIAKRNPRSILLKTGLLGTTPPTIESFMGSKVRTTRIPGSKGRPGSAAGTNEKITARGGYAGTAGAIQAARAEAAEYGLKVTSAKRATRSTATGNVSDHFAGNKSAYAYDLGNGKLEDKAKLRAAQAIARRYGVTFRKDSYQSGGTFKTDEGTFRIQILYGAGVDHADHVHVGIARVK